MQSSKYSSAIPSETGRCFFYKDHRLFQSRLYSDEQADLNKQYRNLMQQALAVCLDELNFWKLITNTEKLNDCYTTVMDSNQYPD